MIKRVSIWASKRKFTILSLLVLLVISAFITASIYVSGNTNNPSSFVDNNSTGLLVIRVFIYCFSCVFVYSKLPKLNRYKVICGLIILIAAVETIFVNNIF